MTGGLTIVLGRTGRNFAAGMSGGFAFVYDEDHNFLRRCNQGMVALEKLEHPEDIATLKYYVERHQQLTGSTRARDILSRWEESLGRFVKVFPHEFRRALTERNQPMHASVGSAPAGVAS
jgi:glutamate synthase domain-containing protein 3